MNHDGGKPTVPAPPMRIDGERIGRSPVSKPCEHDYEFLYSDFQSSEGAYQHNWKQIDKFYCRKCLVYNDVLAKNEDDRYRPSWYKE